MTALDQRDPTHSSGSVQRPEPRRLRLGSVEFFAIVVVAVLVGRGWLLDHLQSPRAQTLITVFVSIIVQATPFLVLGTLASAALTAFVPARWSTRALPQRPAVAVPVAGLAGVVLPVSECGSVPVAGALVRRGVAPAAAFAFLLAAPAINPVVLVSTAVAFPGRPSMVFARLVASLAAAVIMGWLWLRFGRPEWLAPLGPSARQGIGDPHTATGWPAFWASCRQDVVAAGGFLVIGAFAAASLNVTFSPRWLEAVAAEPAFAVVALALLAVLLSICSEADAFVAASLSQFSLTARLAFLVVGPMVDLKLFAMQVGSFGPRFAIRFAPATFVVGVLVSAIVGVVLL
ncbi:MAG: permease [Micromonosporaceae bacterium]